MHTTATNLDRLPAVMAADAVVSGALGVALLLGVLPLSDWLGLPPPVLAIVGALVIAHAAVLWWSGRRPHLVRAGARYAVVGNLGWVLGAAVVLAFDVLSTTAVVTLVATTLGAGAFGIAQWRLLR